MEISVSPAKKVLPVVSAREVAQLRQDLMLLRQTCSLGLPLSCEMSGRGMGIPASDSKESPSPLRLSLASQVFQRKWLSA